jgi:hypothetical protein
MIKSTTHPVSSNNDERRQVLPSRIIWDNNLDLFEEFRKKVEKHYGQNIAGYLFVLDFQEVYLEKGVDCYVDFLDEVPSTYQIKKDSRALCTQQAHEA